MRSMGWLAVVLMSAVSVSGCFWRHHRHRIQAGTTHDVQTAMQSGQDVGRDPGAPELP